MDTTESCKECNDQNRIIRRLPKWQLKMYWIETVLFKECANQNRVIQGLPPDMYLVVRPLLLRPTALERVPLKLLSFPFLAVLPNTGLI